MTATKDEWRGFIDHEIELNGNELAEDWHSKQEDYLEEKEKMLNKIRSILNLHFSLLEGWLPTPENINVLPDPIRAYIHDIETSCDPARMVRENVILKDTIKALQQSDISEEERKMAIWYFKHHIGYGATESDRFYKIILKTLGESK